MFEFLGTKTCEGSAFHLVTLPLLALFEVLGYEASERLKNMLKEKPGASVKMPRAFLFAIDNFQEDKNPKVIRGQWALNPMRMSYDLKATSIKMTPNIKNIIAPVLRRP